MKKHKTSKKDSESSNIQRRSNTGKEENMFNIKGEPMNNNFP